MLKTIERVTTIVSALLASALTARTLWSRTARKREVGVIGTNLVRSDS